MEGWAWAVLTGAALVTAGISGVLGMAGGVTLLGVMTAVMPPAWVVPLHGVVQLSSNGTRALVLLRYVEWRIFGAYAPTLVIGVAAATALWSANLTWFRPGIGLFILLFLGWRRWQPSLRTLPRWTYAPLGLVTGFLTVYVGATGPFIAPFFLRDDLSKERIVGTKAACQLWGHLLKVPAFLVLGFDFSPHLPLLATLVAAVVAGTLLGRAVLARIPPRAFTLAFEAVLAALAVYLLGNAFV